MRNATTPEEWFIQSRPFGWEFSNPPPLQSFHFEKAADPVYWHDVYERYWKLPLYCGPVYVLAIFGLQKYLKTKPALHLQGPLFLWNLTLGIFSIFGVVRTAPGLLSALSQPNGLYNSICIKNLMDLPTCYWTNLFVLSKFWELGDTIFIVLRKRPLIFLHWYHHLVTMTVCWWIAPLYEPIARWTVVMNFGVHALMYNYFALRAIGVRIPDFIGNIITSLQLIQMIIGFAVNMASLYFLNTGSNCARYPFSMNLFGITYGSYSLLFGKLFYDKVINSERKQKDKLS